MATFTDKARKLERVRAALKRRYGDPQRAPIPHPVEHAIRAILAEEATPDQVEAALERFRETFVDFNELRVTRPREIREALGEAFPQRRHKARVIPRLLDQIFKRHNSMIWDFLEALGKTDTRAYFEALEEVRPFVAAVMARDFADAHAFPVDRDVARVLGRLGILDPETEREAEMQALLERAVKNPRVWETHALVKRHAWELCTPEDPACADCPVLKACPEGKRRLDEARKEAAEKKKTKTGKKKARVAKKKSEAGKKTAEKSKSAAKKSKKKAKKGRKKAKKKAANGR